MMEERLNIHSIRFKTTFVTIVAILASVIVVFAASFSTVKSEVDRRSVDTMNLIGQNTAQILEGRFDAVSRSVETVSSIAVDTLDVAKLVEGGVVGKSSHRMVPTSDDTEALDTYLAAFCDDLHGTAGTIASHTRGVITYYFCITPAISQNVHGFYCSKVGKAGFAEEDPIDARKLDPGDLVHNTWYFTPVMRGRPSWVGPYADSLLGDMTVLSYLVPIYKAGTLIGVLGMDISVDSLVEQVASIRVYDTGFACLLDDRGRVIYHPTLPPGSTPELSVDLEMVMREDSGAQLIRYTAEGRDRQMSFTTLSNDMKLLVVAPTVEVNASTDRLIRQIVEMALFVVTVFGILVYIVMRFVVRPLQRLTAASVRLADADYDVELDYTGNNEVGALTLAFVRMRDQLRDYIQDLNAKVNTDDLTGLANQRHFFELAERRRDQLLSEGRMPVMCYFNLVGMKNYNRQYGFAAGDALIRAVADVLVAEFGHDNCARFAQDHFCVVSDEDEVEAAVGRVLRTVAEFEDERTLPMSVGLYQYRLSGEGNVSIACDRAKYACDWRRGSYVSGYRFFDADMQRKVDLSRHIIDNFDRALAEGWVKVYYQPIVRTVSGKVSDEEALSRWIDPYLGFLSPDSFISTLEDAGLIYKLDLYVLDRVLEKMVAERESGRHPVAHSVNLSRSDFDSCDIVDEICRRVDAAGIDHADISIEITESIIGADFDFMREQVARFRKRGFPVWMDDFGSGYSSLDVLQTIEFDLLKFDMSFMRNLDQGTGGKIIVSDLMRMALSLGAETVCEGVETEEQFLFLRDIGCTKAQGYYFGKPAPMKQMAELEAAGMMVPVEDPAEAPYFESLGSVSLFDPGLAYTQEIAGAHHFIGTIPMAVVERAGDGFTVVRSNLPYRELESAGFTGEVKERLRDAIVETFEDRPDQDVWNQVIASTDTGTVVYAAVRRLATNPVNGNEGYCIVVFSVVDAEPSSQDLVL